jgi:hypothetical protein
MQYENEAKMTAIFNLDVLASFIMLIGMLIDFSNNISGHFAGLDPAAGITHYAFFMVAITFLSILILLIYGVLIYGINKKGSSFIWLPVCYVLFAFMSTVLSGMYPLVRLPFRFVELFYWVAVMILSYYAVLSLNTAKFHVAIVVLAIPYLSYRFFVMRGSEVTSSMLLLNPVFYISFLMPIVLLLRSKVLKISLLLLIFAVIVLSYKRMAIIAYAMSILVYFYCLSKTSSTAGILRTIAIFLGAVMFIGVLAFSFRYMSGAFGLDWNARMGNIVEGGGGGRFERWRAIVAALASQPRYWPLGHGWGALSSSPFGWAHNDILEILYDFGFIGFLFYVLFAVKILRIFFEMKRLRYRHFAAFAVSLVWAFWGGMTDVFINYPYHSLGIALFWGITIADFENAKRQGYISEIDDPLYIGQYDDEAADVPYA